MGGGVSTDRAPHEPTFDERPQVHRDPLGPMGATSSLAWSLTRDDAPDPVPATPYLASYITKVGRFGRIDPREHGLLWNRWRWLGLLFWVVVVAGSLTKAWRDVGGIGGQD